MTSQSSRTQTGFSLIELIVAMTVTMVITGAVYGLMSGGQGAFRREPELTDRQQNIRMAMDLIMRDVANAGAGMPSWMQVFTRELEGDAACGSCTGTRFQGPDSRLADELEMITNASGKDNEPSCNSPGSSGNIILQRGTSGVPNNTVVLVLMEDGTWTMRNVVDTNLSSTSSGNCDNGSGIKHVGLNTNSGAGDTTNMNPPGSACKPNAFGTGTPVCTGSQTPATDGCIDNSCVPKEVSFAEVVRYRIRSGADGVPELQRSTTGNFTAGFQSIARGIENLQVEYTQAGTATTWVNGAPQVIRNNYPTVIQQVRITLAARSEARNIQGATNSATGGARIRGTLTSTGTPRSALIHLANGPAATQQWR